MFVSRIFCRDEQKLPAPAQDVFGAGNDIKICAKNRAQFVSGCALFVFAPIQIITVFPVPALGAQALVFHVPLHIDSHLIPLKNIFPIDFAAVAGGFSAAGADGFHLLNGVRQLQQSGGTGKSAGHKIGPQAVACLLYTSPSPRDSTLSRMPSSA